jgi:hypothetical protein
MRKSKTRRIWAGILLWNGTTGVAWVLFALWRIAQHGMSFVILLATGLLAWRDHMRFLGVLLRRAGTIAIAAVAMAAVVVFARHEEKTASALGTAPALPAKPHGYLGVYVPGALASDAGLAVQFQDGNPAERGGVLQRLARAL